MTCLSIQNDVIMILLLTADDSQIYTYNDIKLYINYLRDVVPTYLVTYLYNDSVEQQCERYPTLFEYIEHKNSFKRGKCKPNLDYFFGNYNESIAEFLNRTTNHFVNDLLPKLRSKEMKKDLLGVN